MPQKPFVRDISFDITRASLEVIDRFLEYLPKVEKSPTLVKHTIPFHRYVANSKLKQLSIG